MLAEIGSKSFGLVINLEEANPYEMIAEHCENRIYGNC